MIRLQPHFQAVLAQHGISISKFSQESGLERRGLYALMKPEGAANRKGGMYLTTAAQIVTTFARLANVSKARAKELLLIDPDEDLVLIEDQEASSDSEAGGK